MTKRDFESMLFVLILMTLGFGWGFAGGYKYGCDEYQRIFNNSLKSDRPKADNKDGRWDVPPQIVFQKKELLV